MLILKDIKKDYGKDENVVNALRGISLNFRESEFVSILGQSGCGKTTLLNIIGGLDKYTSGDLIINGKSTKEYKDKDWDYYRNSTIGFVFQTYNLIPHLNVLENVEIALTLTGISKHERKERATAVLVELGLGDQLKKRPNQLSGGQMQRVAIARALVNNPKIILADEPTGALDTETSVQIMEILKEISKDRLIIMVTHNPILADNYSTRIIKLIDGKLVSDSLSYDAKQEVILEKIKTSKKERHFTSMNFLAAIKLSFKNLIIKKGRTFMTSFAGSIGIIGVALVLAISNGFTGYVNKMQSDTLSGYPISIGTVSANMSSITDMMSQGGFTVAIEPPSDDKLQIVDSSAMLASLSNYNFLSPDFVEYIKDYGEKDSVKSESNRTTNDIQYSYAAPLNIFTKQNNEVKKINTSITTNPLTGATSSSFFEGLGNEDFVKSQYDVVYGDYPSSKNDLALVVSENNLIDITALETLGFDYSYVDGRYESIDLSTIIGENGKEFRLVTNNDYYTANIVEDAITSFTENQNYETMYENENNISLKISGVLRVKSTAAIELYSNGLMYLPRLTTYFNEQSQASQIVTAQRANATTFYKPFKISIGGYRTFSFDSMFHFKTFVKENYKTDLEVEQIIEYSLQTLGASSIPTSINIYPKTFDAKDEICAYIDAWNESEKGENNKIAYTDATSLLSSTLGELIDIISYVLIAFASISLVVSSIMIGIITYVSVIERTKEIGVLRSIGARKKDISRVFNAETILIGLTAGLLGVAISYALCPLINAIIHSLAGQSILANFAILNPLHAATLIAISMVLTLISGLFPSRIAAKKDPVVALRTE